MHRLKFLSLATILCSVNVMAAALLPPDEAFHYSAQQTSNVVEIQFKIASGYYLYKDRLEFKADNPAAIIEEITIPPAKTKYDAVFNKEVQYYDNLLKVRVKFKPVNQPFVLATRVQGCAEAAKVCYMPTINHFQVKP